MRNWPLNAKKNRLLAHFAVILASIFSASLWAQKPKLQLQDVFAVEYASNPRVAPDAKRIVYQRVSMDIMKDRRKTALWLVNRDGSEHRPLADGRHQESAARWAPDGKSIVYLASSEAEGNQVVRRWLETGSSATLFQATQPVKNLEWAPNGRWLAFSMFVPADNKPYVQLPKPPKGAKWAEAPKMIRDVRYRSDGSGYQKEGYWQLFVVPSAGGTPRQLTKANTNHSERCTWTRDSNHIIYAANHAKDHELDLRESEIYQLEVATGKVTQLTRRDGPDHLPVVSPNGKLIAYIGYDDQQLGYQTQRVYLWDREAKTSRQVATKLDRNIAALDWLNDRQLIVQFDDQGTTKIARMSLEGRIEELVEDVGGTTIGRPYASGSFHLTGSTIAYTRTSPLRPADIHCFDQTQRKDTRLTRLNDDLLESKTLGNLDGFWSRKSRKGQRIQAWLLKPPHFDSNKKYPMILEIHGGPFANYGRRFSLEMQLYAAAGYVVLYVNPSGSTGYGQSFGNLIHHDYPGSDYEDLMAVVDEVAARPFVDKDRLYVTGGSGGGVLTSWIVGKTDRFRAAVAAKPVINWYSFTFTTDIYPQMFPYWFAEAPWKQATEYLRRSPIAYVDKVKTPTMLITGEEDWRTPISESEQFYQALKLRKVDTALVRVPGASHAIARRPSHLIAKVAYILKWFEEH